MIDPEAPTPSSPASTPPAPGTAEPDSATAGASLRTWRRNVQVALAARLRAYLFAGILLTAPFAITVYLAWLFISFVDARVTPLIPARFNPESHLPFAIPGLGLVIVVVGLILIGAFTAGYVGRLLTGVVDNLLARMPVVRTIYAAVKQIIETVLAQKSQAFREAVLVEYPRRGLWTIGFLSGATSGEVQAVTREEMINVFVPTTPNPTSGFLLFVPRTDVVRLAMSVEDALKMVVSGGIVTPPAPVPPVEDTPVVAG